MVLKDSDIFFIFYGINVVNVLERDFYLYNKFNIDFVFEIFEIYI